MASKAFVILTLTLHKEGEDWVGVCQELSTSTFASTFEEARDELTEMVDLHLSELEEVGELERFFDRHHIKLYTDDAPEFVQQDVHVGSGEYVSAVRVTVSA